MKSLRPSGYEYGPGGGVSFVKVCRNSGRVGDDGAGRVVLDDGYGVERRDTVRLRASGCSADLFGESLDVGELNVDNLKRQIFEV